MGFFGCYFPAGRRAIPLLSGHQHIWGCCSAFASLSPTPQADTTETVTLLIPNSSSASPSHGPGSCPLSTGAHSTQPQTKKGRWQLSAGRDREFPAPGLREGAQTRGAQLLSVPQPRHTHATTPARAQRSHERSEDRGQRRCPHESAHQTTQENQ